MFLLNPALVPSPLLIPTAATAEILLCGSSRHRGEPKLGFAALGDALPLALGDMEDGVGKKVLGY